MSRRGYPHDVSNEKRVDFLLSLYEMAGGNPLQGVLDEELATKLNMDITEFRLHAEYLKEEGLIKYQTFSSISLTHEGRKEAERIMSEAYAEREHCVLLMIRDISRMSNLVFFQDLAQRLNMNEGELAIICSGLHNQNKINFPGGDFVEMKPAGYKALEPPEPKTSHISYTLQVQNNYGTIQQGQANTIINQSLSEVLPKLAAFIESVREADFDRRDRVVEDLEEIKSLVQGKLNPGIWELIQAKFISVEASLKIAGVVYKSHPYWPAISDFFHQVFK
jgi:hypothetical protein